MCFLLSPNLSCIYLPTLTMEGAGNVVYPYRQLLPAVSSPVFDLLDIRIGTMTEVVVNVKARVPGFKVKVNFGEGFSNLKQSAAQLRDCYVEGVVADSAAHLPKVQLHGMQVAAVANFPVRKVGIPSYFLTLGVVSLGGEHATALDRGTVVLRPLLPCEDGAQVKLLNDRIPSCAAPRLPEVTYEASFHLLDVRAGTVLGDRRADFGEMGLFALQGDYPLLQEGQQVLRVWNLQDKEHLDNLLGVVTPEGVAVPLLLERAMPNGRYLA